MADPRRSARIVALMGAATAVRLGTQAGLVLVAAVVLDLADFARFAAAVAAIRLVAPVAEVGGRVVLIRRREAGEVVDLRAFVLGRLASSCVIALAVQPVLVLALDLPWPAALALGSLVPANTVHSLLRAVFLAERRYGVHLAVDLFRAATSLGLVAALGVATLAGWAAVLASGSWLFVVAVTAAFTRGRERPPAGRRRGWGEWRAGSLIALALLAQSGAMGIDQVLLGALGSSGDVAAYALAAQTAFAAILPINVLAEFYMAPMLGSSSDRVGRRFRRLAVLVVGVAAIASPPFWVVMDRFTDVEGSTVAVVSVALLACYLPRLLVVPTTYRLHRERRDGERLSADVTSLTSNVVMNLVLIPLVGLWGAVVATAASEIAFVLLIRHRADRADPPAGDGVERLRYSTRPPPPASDPPIPSRSDEGER